MLISKTRKLVFAAATRRLDESGESMLAWQVLAVLIRAKKLSQTEVAVALAQHAAGVSRLVDDLEKQGYVARCRDSADRRSNSVARACTFQTPASHRAEAHEQLAERENAASSESTGLGKMNGLEDLIPQDLPG